VKVLIQLAVEFLNYLIEASLGLLDAIQIAFVFFLFGG
jgi:hypothetical protein